MRSGAGNRGILCLNVWFGGGALLCIPPKKQENQTVVPDTQRCMRQPGYYSKGFWEAFVEMDSYLCAVLTKEAF